MRQPENKKKITRIIAGLMIIASISVTLISVSYSWIKRQWSPSVSGENIRIEASGALAFKLDGTNSVQNTVSITDGLGSNFVLHPVSNATGRSEDFFTLNRDPASELDYYYEHITSDGTPSGWKTTGRLYGYIETSFNILYGEGADASADSSSSDGRIKFVYLDTAELKNSLENSLNAAQAARVSITVERMGQNITYVLGIADNTNSKAITDARDENGTYLAHGVKYFLPNGEVRTMISDDVSLHKNVHVEDMKYYDGGIQTMEVNGEASKYVDPSKCLFEIQSRTDNKRVTVRIWLEGCDPLCVDDIGGMQLDALLSFSAADCSITPVKVDGKEYYRIIEQGKQ